MYSAKTPKKASPSPSANTKKREGLETGSSPPPPTGSPEVDVYVYFDKVYMLVTVAFLIGLFFVPEGTAWILFTVYAVVMCISYLYKNKIFDITHLFIKKEETTDTSSTTAPTDREEVFHVANQQFDYLGAEAVCKAYNARLATYKEIEDAYNKGADWCSYGWSEGQNAFFPTQQATFDKLQTIPGHEHDCGRPGINGGYISEPSFEFGANCYGKKPAMTEAEKMLMDATAPSPETTQDVELEKEVAYWKQKLPELLISPFNKNTWDEPYVRV